MQFYSQDQQDKYLYENIFSNYFNGTAVSIGAYDGIDIDNTLFFEKNLNWKVINIEPLPKVFERLSINRPNSTNINCAISDIDGEEDFYLNTGYTSMISGLVKSYDPRHLDRLHYETSLTKSKTDVIKVKTKRLDTLFDELDLKYIDVLFIDTEGSEFKIIKSIDFDKVIINVIVFEVNYEDVGKEIVRFLEGKGYYLLHKSMDYFMKLK